MLKTKIHVAAVYKKSIVSVSVLFFSLMLRAESVNYIGSSKTLELITAQLCKTNDSFELIVTEHNSAPYNGLIPREITNYVHDTTWYYCRDGNNAILINTTNKYSRPSRNAKSVDLACGKSGNKWWNYSREDGLWIAVENESFQIHRSKYPPVTVGESLRWKVDQVLNLGIPNVLPGTFVKTGDAFTGNWGDFQWVSRVRSDRQDSIEMDAVVTHLGKSYRWRTSVSGNFEAGLFSKPTIVRRFLIEEDKPPQLASETEVTWYQKVGVTNTPAFLFDPDYFRFLKTNVFVCTNGTTIYTNSVGAIATLSYAPITESQHSALTVLFVLGCAIGLLAIYTLAKRNDAFPQLASDKATRN